MAHPSLKEEKTELILQAYERCIAKHGVEGATLQKVAEEAGIARALLRHHVGNQEVLLSKSISRFFSRQQEQIESLNEIDSIEALMDAIFDKRYFNTLENGVTANDIMIASAFILASNQYPEIKKRTQAWFEQLQHGFITALQRFYPKVAKEQISVVATGLIGIYFNLYAMQPIDQSEHFIEQSRQATELLLDTLATSFSQ